MRRAPGWIVLAGIGLELTVLACALRFMERPSKRAATTRHTQPVFRRPEPVFRRDPEPVEARQTSHEDNLSFITDETDETTRLYRANDESGLELFAAFLSDGRVRLADPAEYRFVGLLQNGRADLLDVANNRWIEMFLRVAPTGQMQLELRGGPYDAHVLTCEPMTK